MTIPTTWDRPADRLRDSAEREYERLRSNAALSSEARLALLADAYVKAKAQMDQLAQRAGQATETRMWQLKRSLFGVDGINGDAATVAIAFRDAVDRVANLDAASGQVLSWLLEQAELAGDESLAQAVFNAAATGGMQDETIVNDFLATRPRKRAAYDELMQAQRPQDSATMFEYVLVQPLELSSMPNSMIENLASRAAAYASMMAG